MATSTTESPRKHKLTVSDYYRLAEAGGLREDDRVELVAGELIDLAPIGSPHASKVVYLTQLLQRAVGDHALVSVQNPLRLETYSEPQPDLMLLKPRADYYQSGHPTADDVLLVVEVAAGSLKFDVDIKIPLYARHGIAEVWLLDLEGQRLAIHRQPAAEGYGSITDSAPLTQASIEALREISVDLAGLL